MRLFFLLSCNLLSGVLESKNQSPLDTEKLIICIYIKYQVVQIPVLARVGGKVRDPLCDSGQGTFKRRCDETFPVLCRNITSWQ